MASKKGRNSKKPTHQAYNVEKRWLVNKAKKAEKLARLAAKKAEKLLRKKDG